MKYSYQMRVPKDRVAVLIGKNGSVKREIEKATSTKLKVESKRQK